MRQSDTHLATPSLELLHAAEGGEERKGWGIRGERGDRGEGAVGGVSGKRRDEGTN
jgi:hypothetical protein